MYDAEYGAAGYIFQSHGSDDNDMVGQRSLGPIAMGAMGKMKTDRHQGFARGPPPYY